jgi:hypothetical protein
MASAADDGEILVGTARVEITPPPQGNFQKVNDPLHAKAIVFRQGEVQAALVFCDMIGVPREVTRPARDRAAARTGIAADRIAITATHTHTGGFRGLAFRGSAEGADVEGLVAKLVEAITLAQRAARPARLEVGVARQDDPTIAFNRRFHMRTGPVRFNPGSLNPDIVRPAGPTDPDVGVLLVRDPDGNRPRAALTVFAMHLDTWAQKVAYSADYPYYLERALRKSLGDAFDSLFGTSTCGDINHYDVSTKERRSTEVLGTALARTVLAAVPDLRPVSPVLAVRSTVIQAPLQDADLESVKGTPRDLTTISTPDRQFLEGMQAGRIRTLQRLRAQGSTYPVEVQAFRLGKDLALVTLPGEIFVELGLAIKRSSPFRTTLVIELANDSIRYVPTERAFGEGSYETVNSLLKPGGGEMMVEAATRLLRELAEQH